MIFSRPRRLALLGSAAAVLPIPIPPVPPIPPITIPTPTPAPTPAPPPAPPPASTLRTVRVAPPGVDPNGPSGEPSIGGNGRYVAFASEASNLGPKVGSRRISNIYVHDFVTGQTSLISRPNSGGNSNGASTDPAISADGQVVAFASKATNLVRGTKQRVSEIFVRIGSGPLTLVSFGFGGTQPDGDCTQPVISDDGRYVAFSSTADNLVAGDDNANSDVFVADLTLGTITRVSVGSQGGQATGSSINPSISGDGRFVSFTSTAKNLVARDRNRVADVFVHNMVTGATQLVSRSSRGKPQNRSVASPFTQVSSLDRHGDYIAFDSDATNLASGDRNGHTDVFRHSLLTGRTWLVSQSSVGREGDNDSFSPSLSADSQVTVFESFADNLATPWTPSENVFAQDSTTQTTTTPDVTPQGAARGPELDAQLLQRPAISADGRFIAFTSGANNLVSGDHNGTDDVFIRDLSPPQTSVVQAPPARTSDRRPAVRFSSNDPQATYALCELDQRRMMCPLGRTFRLGPVRRGAHVLTVLAGAPGTRFDPQGVTVRFTET